MYGAARASVAPTTKVEAHIPQGWEGESKRCSRHPTQAMSTHMTACNHDEDAPTRNELFTIMHSWEGNEYATEQINSN